MPLFEIGHGKMDESAQRGANPSGPLVLRQNDEAEFHRYDPVSQDKDVGGLGRDSKTTEDGLVDRLSDEVRTDTF